MEQSFNNFIYGFLGWLAGILSLIIVEKDKEARKKQACKIAIESDLKNLAIRLVATYSKIQRYLGVYDRNSLQKLKKTYDSYAQDDESEMIKNINDLLKKMDEAQINEIHLKPSGFDALGLKKFSLPFIQFNQDTLLLFDEKYQRSILEILSQIEILNEEVELAMEFYHKTFDPNCMGTNEGIVRGNLSNCHANIQRACNYILDKIDRVLE